MVYIVHIVYSVRFWNLLMQWKWANNSYKIIAGNGMAQKYTKHTAQSTEHIVREVRNEMDEHKNENEGLYHFPTQWASENMEKIVANKINVERKRIQVISSKDKRWNK